MDTLLSIVVIAVIIGVAFVLLKGNKTKTGTPSTGGAVGGGVPDTDSGRHGDGSVLPPGSGNNQI